MDHLSEFNEQFRDQYQSQRVALSFSEYIAKAAENPQLYARSSAEYLLDIFRHFGMEEKDSFASQRYKVFDLVVGRNGPIIGCERVHERIVDILEGFKRQGYVNKLILLHGPNGSAKTSTVEAISEAMTAYSKTDEGAVYTFNWIFPTDKSSNPKSEGSTIGFGSGDASQYESESYAYLGENKIACKLHSELRDNPLFLLPMPYREKLLKSWYKEKPVPQFLLYSGLSKKNQLIFENLLLAYDGDFSKVMRHVQVERFYFSRQYRVGAATVEPQMALDAAERQLTMDKNVQNLPSFLHNIRFTEVLGPLIEANRGILEFSDMLKRPVEAYKYLLNTVEKNSINLPSSTADLDIVYFATTNEKHLDAFKQVPDFSSFRSRFELITVPYLLKASEEEKIYKEDMLALKKKKKVAPHALKALCTWAVMTRYKQPDPEKYDPKVRVLIARLDPRMKLKLYEKESLQPVFKTAEESVLRSLRFDIYNESQNVPVYEGRFGASPRELKQIITRAASNPSYKTLTPMAIFSELRKIIKDKTVYEFLQFEPRGRYHDVESFIKTVELEFIDTFEHEVLLSMSLVEDDQYDNHLKKYIDFVVAYVKKEKVVNAVTSSSENPSEDVMREVEKVLGVTGSVERFRQDILGRIAAYKIENPKADMDMTAIFGDLLKKMQDHYHSEKQSEVEKILKAMISDDDNLSSVAEDTYERLESRFGYDRDSAESCVRFLLSNLRR